MQFDVNIRLYEYWHEQVEIRIDWLVFNVQRAIVQLYSGRNKEKDMK
jgi:hypothetical protein